MRAFTQLLAIALLGTPAAALAQAKAAAPQSITKADYLANTQQDFAEIDTNKDGTVTTAELETARSKVIAAVIERRSAAAFTQLDTDKNGSLSQAEFAKMMKPSGKLPPAPLLAFDLNKDGKITAAEYKTGVEARFARLDANKDGVVTAAEAKPASPSR